MKRRIFWSLLASTYCLTPVIQASESAPFDKLSHDLLKYIVLKNVPENPISQEIYKNTYALFMTSKAMQTHLINLYGTMPLQFSESGGFYCGYDYPNPKQNSFIKYFNVQKVTVFSQTSGYDAIYNVLEALKEMAKRKEIESLKLYISFLAITRHVDGDNDVLIPEFKKVFEFVLKNNPNIQHLKVINSSNQHCYNPSRSYSVIPSYVISSLIQNKVKLKLFAYTFDFIDPSIMENLTEYVNYSENLKVLATTLKISDGETTSASAEGKDELKQLIMAIKKRPQSTFYVLDVSRISLEHIRILHDAFKGNINPIRILHNAFKGNTDPKLLVHNRVGKPVLSYLQKLMDYDKWLSAKNPKSKKEKRAFEKEQDKMYKSLENDENEKEFKDYLQGVEYEW